MFQYFFSYESDIPRGLEVKNFSPVHLAWLAATALALYVLLRISRRMNGEARRRFTRMAMIAVFLLEAMRQTWVSVIGHYDIGRHLPLQLCGILIFVEAAAVFTERPFFKEFSYACGLPGAAMALMMPEPGGYPFWNIQYLQSIAIGALLVLIPLVWITGDGFRPSIRALPKNLALLAGLMAFCFVLNLVLGGHANYLWLRFAPAGTPAALLDGWAGWPWYIGLLLGLVSFIWVLMYVPWEISNWKRKKTDEPKSV